MTEHSQNEQPERSHWVASIVTGLIVALVSGVVLTIILEPSAPGDLRAKWTQGDDIERVAEGYFRDLAAGRVTTAVDRLDSRALGAHGGRQKLIDALGGNPINYANVEVTPSDITGSRARASVEGQLTLRGARSGCRTYVGDFRLRHTRQGWKITRLPSDDSGHSCTADADALRASWIHAPPDARGIPESGIPAGESGSYALFQARGADVELVGRTAADPRHPLPAWARGHLQRVDPESVVATSSRDGGGKKGWRSINTVDVDDDQDGRAWTSWISRRGVAGESLKYTFPVPVRLAYVRFKNGLGTDSDRSAGPIRIARLSTDDGSHLVLFPRYRTLFTYLCDIGPTRHLTLSVEAAYGSPANVALSQIEFWGRAWTQATRHTAASLASPPLLQRIGAVPSTAQYVERCDGLPQAAT
jgi:hypothetical protein